MKQHNWSILPLKYLTKYGSQYIQPDAKELFGHLKIDNFVQLIFRSNPEEGGFIGVEKLWCKITGFKDGQYRGTLMDQPRIIAGLNQGDSIHFNYDYVIGFNRKMVI